METRITGIVKWFSKEKGYGFITRDDNGEDIFIHHSGIKSNGFRTLEEGQRVSFHIAMTDKGKRAVETKIIEEGNGETT